MSNNTDNTLTRLSSAISIRQTQTNKIQHLVEYTHIPESAQITETVLPLLNPYTIFKRSRSLSRRVMALVQHRSPPIKEYVQSTALDNCLIPASSTEQYVDLEIGQPLIDQWIKEGYSHLHIGAIRIILTLYGRKGLPVTARIALLNTFYKQYEHAIIGTCLSTLHAGSISLTYYPNFNIPLRDLNLHNCLKIQLQIVGAPMMPNSYMATLHHQIAYRLQDHALDLPIPGHTGDTIFIKAEREDEVPTIIQIPKQLPREKLTEIMHLKWITNYEKAFQNITPVVATDTKFTKLADGSIQATYEQIGTSETSTSATETAPSAPPVFQVLMIRPVTTEQEIPIHRFEADGTPVYTDKVNGHFIWDVDPEMCDADCECRVCQKPVKASCKPVPLFRDPKDPHSPWIGLRPIKNKPLPIYDRALQILKEEGLLLDEQTEKLLPAIPVPIPCYMASSYDKDFPPLESSSNPERNLFSRPFIQSTEVLPDGSLKKPSQAEQVLNWHTRNATVQNRVLHSIDQKIDKVSHHVSQHDNQLQHLDSTLRNMYTDLQSRVSRLDEDLHQYISQGYFGPEFDSKEREIRFLKDQLDQIKRDHFTSTPYLPRPHPYSPSLIFPTQSPPPPSRPLFIKDQKYLAYVSLGNALT
ncbi:hypothetical protein Ddye_001301 [Dipteronia dyeriana]|uniref:Polyprotein n=1 Tax=Dipteronia dyeriana TaxID=168575 RepID=A0AAE0CTC3_9ROSI|nr:hypothetical protein Ddye_001301 [Dipteronia dyeriana]